MTIISKGERNNLKNVSMIVVVDILGSNILGRRKNYHFNKQVAEM